jgi:hypothetical protein
VRLAIIRALGLEPFLTRCVEFLNRMVRPLTKSDRTDSEKKP